MISNERAEEISKQYYQKTFNFCFSLSKNNYDAAADITQEVFLVFAKKRNELTDDKIDRWLVSVARKKAYEYYRKRKNEEMIITLEESFTSPEDVLSTFTRFYSVSDADIKMTIEAITKMLTKSEYELFVKKFLENKTQAEIAEELGISVSNVSTRIARLRNKIEALGFLCLTLVGQAIIKSIF